MCVCLPPRLLITSSVMWCDTDLYDWFKTFIMTAVVGIYIINRRGLRIEVHHNNIETNLLLKTVISLRN